jgi:1-acyl-sn-glycerol-3-phosphate acyltransferase
MPRFFPWLFHLIYYRLGNWKCDMRLPEGLKKGVILAVPHTATRDFPIGLGASYKMTVKHGFLGKRELFDGPFGFLFKMMGGIPVDRSASKNMVDQVAALIDREDEFFLVMAPEGTRQRTERWKTGFYYIAKKLNVPIILGYIDFGTKRVGLDKVLYPTWDEAKDFAAIEEFYSTITAMYPEKFNPRLQ